MVIPACVRLRRLGVALLQNIAKSRAGNLSICPLGSTTRLSPDFHQGHTQYCRGLPNHFTIKLIAYSSTFTWAIGTKRS